jgi:hypothetical protein
MEKQYLVSKTSQNIMADLRYILGFKHRLLGKGVELKLVHNYRPIAKFRKV